MKRSSGVLMHVSSLWGDYGVGSFGKEAREWIDFLASCGFHAWQVLPFCLPDECNSPYKSHSAFSANPYFIDLPTLFSQGLLTREELDAARQTTPYTCEFDRLRRERLPLLAKAAARVKDRAPIHAFLDSHPQVANFCRYMAIKASNGGADWIDWTTDRPDAEELWVWQFTQYEFSRQWKELKAYANGRGVSIIGDIPIYVAYDSSDGWANRSLFQLDQRNRPTAVAGVPPDYFCEDGQLWGNPLYDWKEMKKEFKYIDGRGSSVPMRIIRRYGLSEAEYKSYIKENEKRRKALKYRYYANQIKACLRNLYKPIFECSLKEDCHNMSPERKESLLKMIIEITGETPKWYQEELEENRKAPSTVAK